MTQVIFSRTLAPALGILGILSGKQALALDL